MLNVFTIKKGGVEFLRVDMPITLLVVMYHGYLHMSKLSKLYTLNMCPSLYISFLNKATGRYREILRGNALHGN